MSASHPDDATLLRSIHGDLPGGRNAAVRKHLAGCGRCRMERDGLRNLHARLSDVGDSLAFKPGDVFESRPVAPARDRDTGSAVRAMAAALKELEGRKSALRAAIETDAMKAAQEVNLDDPPSRLATAHILETAVDPDPSEALVSFAAGIAARPISRTGEAEAVLPGAQLEAVARTVKGNGALFCGRPEEAAPEFTAAWVAMAEFDAPEHLVAWTEVGESLRRSYAGRPVEGRLLAERALGTFEAYDLKRGILRARHARAVALYMTSRFRDAHREFRVVIRSRAGTRLDRARGVSGAAFCLAGMGRCYEPTREYSRLRRRLVREGAGTEHHLLQAEMRVALGTAGRWSAGDGQTPSFALPEADGALLARQCALRFFEAVASLELNVAWRSVEVIEPIALRFYAFLYVAQLAMPRISTNPMLYFEVSKRLRHAAGAQDSHSELHPSTAVQRDLLSSEARLLASNCLNHLGRPGTARAEARAARRIARSSTSDPFGRALLDYYEGSAASFAGTANALELLENASVEFGRLGLEHWRGRADAARATHLMSVNRQSEAIGVFDSAIRKLDRTLEVAAYASSLTNRAGCLMLTGRLEAARPAFAHALQVARKSDLKVSILVARYCLAAIDIRRGRVSRALEAFERVAASAEADGLPQRVFSARLRAAECLGYLGRHQEMLDAVRELRLKFRRYRVESDAEIRALFAAAERSESPSKWALRVTRFVENRANSMGLGAHAVLRSA